MAVTWTNEQFLGPTPVAVLLLLTFGLSQKKVEKEAKIEKIDSRLLGSRLLSCGWNRRSQSIRLCPGTCYCGDSGGVKTFESWLFGGVCIGF